jgi:hypothetical protein
MVLDPGAAAGEVHGFPARTAREDDAEGVMIYQPIG